MNIKKDKLYNNRHDRVSYMDQLGLGLHHANIGDRHSHKLYHTIKKSRRFLHQVFINGPVYADVSWNK